jgi:hypothetical protein
MRDLLSNYVEALRQELQQYGEILARLDQEQEAITQHGPEAILSSIASVNAQTQVIEDSRQHRIAVQRAVARELQRPEEAPLLELLPLLPAPHHLLIAALVAENNSLLERVRERAEQNHRKLKQSTDLMRRVVVKFVQPADPPLSPQELLTNSPLPAAI